MASQYGQGQDHDEHEHGHDRAQSGNGQDDDAHQHGHAHAGDDGLWSRLRHLFQQHSHDAAESVDNALVGSDEGIRAVKLSLIGLGLTTGLQLAVAMASGSVAVLADTIHNFADASTAIPLWLAFSIGRKPANDRYTYGYGRAEDLAGVFVLVMIIVSAVVAFWESLQRLLQPTPILYLGWVAAAAAGEAPGVQGVSLVRARWIGHAIHAEALIVADADLTLRQAHEVAERARHNMLHAVPRLSTVTVHVDPCDHDGRDHHADLAHHDPP